jgi:hypothetical protein
VTAARVLHCGAIVREAKKIARNLLFIKINFTLSSQRHEIEKRASEPGAPRRSSASDPEVRIGLVDISTVGRCSHRERLSPVRTTLLRVDED